MFVDTHTHLFAEEFDADLSEVLARARAEKISKFFLPNIDLTSIDAMFDLSNNQEDCYPMVGLHPCSVNAGWEKDLLKLRELMTRDEVIAVGEIGIDLYWDKTFKFEQQLAFEQQIIWAKEFGLPIAIHVRDAFDEVFEVLDRQNDEQLTGVFHCFTGNQQQAEKVKDYGGFYFGIGGVVTFKNGGLDKVLPSIPLDRIVLETDSPYLAPAPNRGKRNESSYIPIIADRVSDILALPLTEIEQQTTMNAKKLFPKAF